ncbi:5'-nucleotidase /3'-nucleotidase /exopolyphosphatase [Chitinophaga terrae (ex Kim and Jung 2007)]|uniref:5'-nucleotidase SurE n=1 Tax=Chitinophaga terrae (ex Kim and Jung 2007) TaxID=408074 RepID=A0A1H4DPG5_9BACT|nr:5'/3'-nucleotidase SurE [Chitinophaga terrae (ex Kim and Jung 2007)]MDQ0107874.1 5'-nucleotidase [Chitinophaga terrae (ex Kim and Jung 2007)]GEP91045.1 5'-nucleotidase SurE [Chitinophaga terrae (ex Kim and Jung 2007)]SEA74507.1 5'-nucleotidase /3'-nucleotidase /exopolyphosphatase [Chitinophaga terrae (ex Kim and Jung 2007)]
MAKKEPVILVTNDDGITAPGIRALIEAVKPLGKVVVVAPDSPQSGKGHAITIGIPLRLNEVDIFGGIEAWQCSGTPVDCVKLARDKILHGKPDICVSGINHGANHSINVIYSGTMSAAMEAAIEGIPSVGFSYLEYSYDADFSLPKEIAHEVTRKMLASQLPEGSLLNVNIPVVSKKEYKGLRLCRQADAKWVEEFDERRDPHGKKYYWLTGEFKNRDSGEDTDVWALENNYASVVPVQFDLTNYTLKKRLEQEWSNL